MQERIQRDAPMARRPVKKRKPRKVPATFGAKEAQVFDIPKPPIGIAYQWVLVDHLDQVSDGWVQVPFDRHSHEMPAKTKVGGYIVYLDNTLVQREKTLVEAELSLSQMAAVKQLQDHPAYQPPYERGGYRNPMPVLSEHFVVSSDYGRIPDGAPSVVLNLTIPFRVSAHLQDAAAALSLTTQEYMQRSISLYVRGETGGLLLPIDGAIELHQIYINDQMRKS